MPAFFGFIFKHQAWLILAVIASFSFALMFWAALTDSLTFDETAHITAAYSHLKLSDYRLVVEPLPLTDFLAGAPLLFQDLNFPLNSHAWQREVADVWVLGKEFIYQAGNRAEDIALSARLGIITSAILGVFFIYFWSRELIGRRWAFLPAILFAFSPSVLAHGHYVTSDILAALGMVIAAYFFLKYLKNPSPQNIFSAGLILGLAELTKPAALILAPLFIILACVWIFLIK